MRAATSTSSDSPLASSALLPSVQAHAPASVHRFGMGFDDETRAGRRSQRSGIGVVALRACAASTTTLSLGSTGKPAARSRAAT
jgi:hypothetical protein